MYRDRVKLLRVLQQGELKRVGSNEIVKVDVRTIAATNVDLQEAMKVGKFREDLFYRLNVITVALPALRERVDDIPLLAYHMLQRCNAKLGKDISGFAGEVLEIFQGYRWQGNVRELENIVERAVVLCRTETIEARHLPGHLQQNTFIKNGPNDYRIFSPRSPRSSSTRSKNADSFVRTGNVSQSSRDAALDRSNFRRVLKKHDIDVDALVR